MTSDPQWGAGRSPAGINVIFSEHFEERQMGEHVREIRFIESIVLEKIQILNRGERPYTGASFEGRTFPNVRTMSLSAYAADKVTAGSTMPRLKSGGPGVFVPESRLITNCIILRGEYMKLSVVVCGQTAAAGDVPPLDRRRELGGVAVHLRPPCTFDADRLDLPDLQEGEEGLIDGLDGADALRVRADREAPPSLARALALGAPIEVDSRVAQYATWVASLPNEQSVLEAELVAGRLEALTIDLGVLARCAPDADAAIVQHGPLLVRALLNLAARCVERLELRPLRATLLAFTASLVAASTAGEALRHGALVQLLKILRDPEWCQSRLKLVALQALMQLCSHAVAMEAFLGWDGASGDPETKSETGYELVVSIVADGTPGFPILELVAKALLKRAAFYVALARLEEACTLLGNESDGADPSSQDVLVDKPSVADALADVAVQLEELSRGSRLGVVRETGHALLEADIPNPHLFADSLLAPLISASGDDDPFACVHPQLHGFLESFLAGRRFVPGLCQLLRRLPRLQPSDRMFVFGPLRRLLCALLSCVGGAQFLASDPPALSQLLSLLNSSDAGISSGGEKGLSCDGAGLPSILRYPERLIHCALGAPQLASLINTHVCATRLVLVLMARTRKKGHNGLLPETEALPLLCALHTLGARGAAGRESVVSSFRSTLFVTWLLRQLDGRFDEAPTNGSATTAEVPSQPSVRHLVAILHTLVLGDPTASVAERFGPQLFALAARGIKLFEDGSDHVDRVDGSWRPSTTSLEFALDSDGHEGGLSRAVRIGRHSADIFCLGQLRELSAQLRLWQSEDGSIQASPLAPGTSPAAMARIFACLRLQNVPRAFMRKANEERGSRLSLLLGGFCGIDAGIEVAEIDFIGESTEIVETDERLPQGGLMELPLLAMRLLHQRASTGAPQALAIALGEDRIPGAASGQSGVAVLVAVLIRCAAALNLNIEALALQEDRESVDEVYAAQLVHLHLLEPALQTILHMLRGLSAAGLPQYRHTELLQALFLVTDRLASNLVGASPTMLGPDPEFQLLCRHCLVLACCTFRQWVQGFPLAAGGQLLQPLLRHARVLPCHFFPGLLFLATCGSLKPLLPTSSHSFALVQGARQSDVAMGEHTLTSQSILFPASGRSGCLGHILLKVADPQCESPFSKGANDRSSLRGQLWGAGEGQDWDTENGIGGAANMAVYSRDPIIRSLGQDRRTACVAAALALAGRVNLRRERLSMDDLGETTALVAQCAGTSDATLHHVAVCVLEKLTRLGITVLATVLRLGESALQGALGTELSLSDGQSPEAIASTGVTRDPRDARTVSRLLLFLAHFGHRSRATRQALVDHRAETLCLSVLSQSPGTLPPMAWTQAIRILTLMCCCSDSSARKRISGDVNCVSARGMLPTPSVSTCRMISKAISLLINRLPEEGNAVGPGTMAAAVELLLQLNSARCMCLQLLFCASEDFNAESSPPGSAVPVTVSCAFRLAYCAQRLAGELRSGDERWEATARGSEAEAEAEEALSSWLNVGERLVSLCQTVLVHCSTAAVFLAVVLPGGAPDHVDQTLLQGVFADVEKALVSITGRRRAESTPLRAAALVGNLRALHGLLDADAGPPPSTLPREDLLSPEVEAPLVVDAGSGDAAEDENEAYHDVALQEVVGILNAAGDLQSDPEWQAVSELDAAEPPGPEGMLEYDAPVLRKKRQAAQEKLENERKSKRAKQQPKKDENREDGGPRDTRRYRRRGARRELEAAARLAKKETRIVAAPPPRPAAAATTPMGAANFGADCNGGGPMAPRVVPPSESPGNYTSAGGPRVVPPPPHAPGGAATVAAQQAAQAAAHAAAQQAAEAHAQQLQPITAEAPKQPPAAAQQQAPPNPLALGNSPDPGVELQRFLKEHPEFMRVLQNPSKSLGDPRVKTMFVKELNNYPVVKAFLTTKGLLL